MIYFLIFILCFLAGLVFYVFFYKKSKNEEVSKKFFKSNIVLILSFLVATFGIFYYNFQEKVKISGPASDIVFVLDVSESMNASDYENSNKYYSRLDVAKNIIKDYVLKYPKNRYSLTIFSGDFTEVLPFTTDLNLFLTFLQNSDSNSIVRGGNVLKEAFVSAIDRFKSEETSGGIVVLSDFEFPGKDKTFLDNYLGNLSANSKDLENNNIKVFTVGVGTIRGANIPTGMDPFGNISYKRDSFGNNVLTKFDNYSFDKFSLLTSGTKIKVENYSDFRNVYSKITNVPSRNIKDQMEITSDYSRYFMIVSYFLFIIYMFLYYFERKINL